MKNVIDPTPWRPNFVDALSLLGQAVTRLPFGVPDPVLRGAAAVELYTGSLWPAAALELLTVAARPLIVELFAVGFHWGRPGHANGGAWHPELQIGIEIAEHRAPMGPAEASNLLAVAIDRSAVRRASRQSASVGEGHRRRGPDHRADHLLADRGGSIDRGCDASPGADDAWEGRGWGRFQVGYLQRRLAWETGGEVVIDAQPGEEEGEDAGAARAITLSQMQAVIDTWLGKSGYSFVHNRSQIAGRRGMNRIRQNCYRNEEPGRAEGRSAIPTNVVPFSGVTSVLHLQE